MEIVTARLILREFTQDDWPAVWNELGLTAIRQHLTRWCQSNDS